MGIFANSVKTKQTLNPRKKKISCYFFSLKNEEYFKNFDTPPLGFNEKF
jgi:hypothetical protein